MADMTYNSLVADIEVYAERSESAFTDQIPSFISLAENRLTAEVKALGYQRYVTGAINGNTVDKPARWRNTISLNITTNSERVFLKERSYDYCRLYSPNPSSTGVPKYYADYGYEHFFIAPTPDAVYDFELAYYERPEPLAPANQTNWTTQYAPQLLLYASLIEAATFLKNPDQLQVWQALYAKAVEGIAREDGLRMAARTEQRATA